MEIISNSNVKYSIFEFNDGEYGHFYHALTEETIKEANANGLEASEFYDVYIPNGANILQTINEQEEKNTLRYSKKKSYRDINDFSENPGLYSPYFICNHASGFTIDIEDKSISVFDIKGLFKTKYIPTNI